MNIAAIGRIRSKRAQHRDRVGKLGKVTLSAKNWRKLKEDVWFRAGGRCENTIAPGIRCTNAAHDPHHIISRGQGGSDVLENIGAVCRNCHRAVTDGQMKFAMWKEMEYDA